MSDDKPNVEKNVEEIKQSFREHPMIATVCLIIWLPLFMWGFAQGLAEYFKEDWEKAKRK